MKLLLLVFSLLTAIPNLAKTSLLFTCSGRENYLSEKSILGNSDAYFVLTLKNNTADFGYSDILTVNTDSLPAAADTVLLVKDTLVVRRHFLTTSIYKDGRSLSRSDIINK